LLLEQAPLLPSTSGETIIATVAGRRKLLRYEPLFKGFGYLSSLTAPCSKNGENYVVELHVFIIVS
jgi:hypothetical protein